VSFEELVSLSHQGVLVWRGADVAGNDLPRSPQSVLLKPRPYILNPEPESCSTESLKLKI
jgi:hypothetical protein